VSFGQHLNASATGMAVFTPKALASYDEVVIIPLTLPSGSTKYSLNVLSPLLLSIELVNAPSMALRCLISFFLLKILRLLLPPTAIGIWSNCGLLILCAAAKKQSRSRCKIIVRV